MSSALGDKAMGIIAGSLQVSHGLVDAVRTLLAATALEDHLYDIRILDLLGSILATAEVRKLASI